MNEELFNILQKVKSLYLKYGIKSVTMDDVSRELGISKKTLYLHVKDKSDLVEKVVELEIEHRHLGLKCESSGNLNAVEELLEVNKMVVDMLKHYNPATEYDLKKYYPELYTRVLESRRKHIHESVMGNIVKGRDEKIYREDFDADIVARLVVMRFECLNTSEIFKPEELSSEKLYTELFIYHIRGIANQDGLNILENKLNKLNK